MLDRKVCDLCCPICRLTSRANAVKQSNKEQENVPHLHPNSQKADTNPWYKRLPWRGSENVSKMPHHDGLRSKERTGPGKNGINRLPPIYQAINYQPNHIVRGNLLNVHPMGGRKVESLIFKIHLRLSYHFY